MHRRIAATEVDPDAAVRHALQHIDLGPLSGKSVCLAVGSRGIDQVDQIVRAMVGSLREAGAQPFVVPAMGSHGGATNQGQVDVLRELGVTEASVGCEIKASMEVVELGTIEGGVRVFFDTFAYSANAVIPINRVKPHTDFSGRIESGLIKMLVIGLGKQRGADAMHAAGFAQFDRLLPLGAELTLSRVSVPFGLAILENGLARLKRVEAVPASEIWQREQVLRAEADLDLPRLPVSDIDVLIIDQIGKDISGLGMDSNVVGRYYTGPVGDHTRIQRIIVRDLSKHTNGNAVGIGLADVVLTRAVAKMDKASTFVNCITAKTPEGARIPITVDTDRDALDVALSCCLAVDPGAARIVRIRDTKSLSYFYASEAVLDGIRDLADCDVKSDVASIGLDANGALTDQWPDAMSLA